MTSFQRRGPSSSSTIPDDEQEQPGEPGVPEVELGEEHDARDGDEREPDQLPRPAAALAQRLLDDRLVAALVRDDERRGPVDQEARAAEQREHDEPDAVEDGVDVEVAAEAAADAGDHPVGAAAAQLFVCERLCHGSSCESSACRGRVRASIRSPPDSTLQSPYGSGQKLIADNRRARHDYELLDRFEAGIVLTGTEVKSLRDGRATLAQAYADVRDGEVWLHGAEIATYDHGNCANHEPTRSRKLLLHRREIDRLYGQLREKGLTLVPTKLYFKDGRVKIELALARGKDVRDKRRTVPDRDAKRQIERAMKSSRR